MKKKNEPKILFYDIETSPNLGYIWAKYEQDVIAFEEEWQLLSVAYRWMGQKKVHCITNRTMNDKKITQEVWKLFNQADILVAHNGDRFDKKKIQAKFLQHGLNPPKPATTIDTLKIAKKHFSLNSNKLNDIAKLLGIGQKVQTGGFDLWLACMKGDNAGWAKMVKYNCQDVVLLQKVYDKFLPWIDNHPSLSILKHGDKDGCHKCGSKNVEKRGLRANAKTLNRQMYCRDCHGWFLKPIKKH